MPTINLIDKSSSLEQICEANYHKLIRLIPDLPSIKRNVIGYASGKPALHIEIIEKAPYTLTLLLSYCFGMKPKNLLEPAVKIRVYLDARMVEVLRDHVRPDVRRAFQDPGQIQDIMDYKWSLNYFLEKWLNHCLQTDYQFRAEQEAIPETG
jgi:uncharacterized protein YqiB (DUF1249 family)